MSKQQLTALLLGCTLSTSTFATSSNNHIEFSYQVDCTGDIYSNYCANFTDSSTYYFDGSKPPAPTPDIDTNNIPRYLEIADGRDWDYLLGQSYTILGLSVATVGLMTLLPESITKWDEDDRDLSQLGSKWKDNVKAGPVWDKDEHFLNYVMHPYFGGVYYTAARHSGFNEFESFLYSATMSTFFWEYGVEAFAEVPSIQDLFVTPFFGAVVGEVMFRAEQDIVADGGEVMGSDTLGDVSLFLLNPVGHIHYWVTGMWGEEAEVNMSYSPWFNNQEAASYALDAGAPFDNQFIGMQVKLKF